MEARAAYSDTVAGYDEAAQRYRAWWGPIIAPGGLRLLDRLAPWLPADRPFTFLDVGAGSGTLTFGALERSPQARVTATDPSSGMRRLVADEARARAASVDGRLSLVAGDAARLPLRSASVDVAATSFVIQLVPSRSAALREARRVLRPGGTFGCVTWQADNSPFEPDETFYDVVDELGLDLPPRGRDPRPYTSPAAAAAELRRAGFVEVSAELDWLEHRYTPESFLGVLEHWAEDELFARLDEATRDRLRSTLLDRLRRLPSDDFLWRRPLVSVLGRRPITGR